MADPTDDVALSSTAESIQALFKETNSRHTSEKAMLRWTLQKTVETHPSCSLLLIRTLVEELQKIKEIHTTEPFVHIIPMLHTLYYSVLQSGAVIPRCLYQTVHECLMNLLILPLPYSAVALSTLKSIKMEMTTPGFLYQRRLIAEQNLKNEHLRLKERVFVLADPAVFSAPLEAAVRADLEASNSLRDTTTHKKCLVLRLLQTGLGSDCQSSRLVQALGALGDHSIEKYFQEAVLAVEQSVKHGAGGYTDYMNKLQHIYTNILAATKKAETKSNDCSECDTVLPNPEINFHLWRDEEDLWNLLANFTLHSNSSVDVEEKETGNRKTDREDDVGKVKKSTLQKSISITSRRNAYKNGRLGNKLSLVMEKSEASPGLKKQLSHTARVVVMGDDRVLGRLAKAFYAIRDKESKRITLTNKLNLQLYYIPVTDVEPSLSSADNSSQEEDTLSLASLLGRVDPWYEGNINVLKSAIPKLDEMQTNLNGPVKQNFFLLDTLCYYIRCGTRPVNLPLYTVKMFRSSSGKNAEVEDVFVLNLEAHIPEFKHIKERSSKNLSRKKTTSAKIVGGVLSVSHVKTYASKRESTKGAVPMTCGLTITSEPGLTSGEDYLTIRYDSVIQGENTEIQTKSITIKTLERRTLTVCLDKDSRRTYKDIQRIEISPCLDPGCKIQSRFSVSRDLPLSKYVDQVLSLPVNTFTGVTL